jgi:hypothetical protein
VFPERHEDALLGWRSNTGRRPDPVRDRLLRADAYATFWLDADGSVHQLRLVPASESVDFSFDFQDLVLKPVMDSTSGH